MINLVDRNNFLQNFRQGLYKRNGSIVFTRRLSPDLKTGTVLKSSGKTSLLGLSILLGLTDMGKRGGKFTNDLFN